jgi:hypothetical protein
MEAVIAYLREEINRLQTLLQAERADSGNRLKACAYYKGAAEAGLAVVELLKASTTDDVERSIQQMGDLIADGDDLLTPTADETE